MDSYAQINCLEVERVPACGPVIGRFEAWLRSHGYDPSQDPFMPADFAPETSTSATELVREYLKERPGEQRNQEELTSHAQKIGNVPAVWGDGGCGSTFWD